MEKKIIVFKNDRLGDLIHGVAAINNILINNKNKKVIVFLSKISEKFSFLFKKKNTSVKVLNYHLSLAEKAKIFFYFLTNKIEKVYILSPKNFYFFLPLFFYKVKFYGICVNGLQNYKRPNTLLRKLLYKYVINDREAKGKRDSIQMLQLKLTNEEVNDNDSNYFHLDIPKSEKIKQHLPSNYMLIHFKKQIGKKLGWRIQELDIILKYLTKFYKNVVLIKDIEKDELNLILRKKYKTLDLDNGIFYNNNSDILFLDNVEGHDLYNVIKFARKVIAFHGTITSIAFLNKVPVLDLFYCNIQSQKDYHSHKNAFYEFKPKYQGYDFIIPSKNLDKTMKKMKFALKNN